MPYKLLVGTLQIQSPTLQGNPRPFWRIEGIVNFYIAAIIPGGRLRAHKRPCSVDNFINAIQCKLLRWCNRQIDKELRKVVHSPDLATLSHTKTFWRHPTLRKLSVKLFVRERPLDPAVLQPLLSLVIDSYSNFRISCYFLGWRENHLSGPYRWLPQLFYGNARRSQLLWELARLVHPACESKTICQLFEKCLVAHIRINTHLLENQKAFSCKDFINLAVHCGPEDFLLWGQRFNHANIIFQLLCPKRRNLRAAPITNCQNCFQIWRVNHLRRVKGVYQSWCKTDKFSWRPIHPKFGDVKVFLLAPFPFPSLHSRRNQLWWYRNALKRSRYLRNALKRSRYVSSNLTRYRNALRSNLDSELVISHKQGGQLSPWLLACAHPLRRIHWRSIGVWDLSKLLQLQEEGQSQLLTKKPRVFRLSTCRENHCTSSHILSSPPWKMGAWSIANLQQVRRLKVHQKSRLFQPVSTIHAGVDALKPANRRKLSEKRRLPHPRSLRVFTNKWYAKGAASVDHPPCELI